MPTIDEMQKEIKKLAREAREEAIGRDREILKLRGKAFDDLGKYLNRASLPKKAEVAHMLGRAKRWLETVKKVPKKGSKK